MIINNIYCKVSGMVMQCVVDWQKENHPRLPIVLEIGCAEGEGVLRYAGFCDRVVCIDPMVSGRPDLEDYEEKDYSSDSGKLAKFSGNTDHNGFNVRLVRKSSLSPSTLTDVRKELMYGDVERSIDILVIDGCHHPERAVMTDFTIYSQFVSDGGFIIFDDTYEDSISNVVKQVLEDERYVLHDEWNGLDHDAKLLQSVIAIRKLA